jgi:hypothetical protein
MNTLKSNLDYFNFCAENPEPVLDDFYIFTEKDKNIQKYINNNKQIKDILITIKTLQNNSENPEIINKYLQKLFENLNQFSNNSEFSCFVNACDNVIYSLKFDTLKVIVNKYLQNRILNEAVPEEWVQALIDNNSSRKKGKCGELKLRNILTEKGFIPSENWQDFLLYNLTFIGFSGKNNLKSAREFLNIDIATKKQNKNLDLAIKIKNKIFICEAKHLNTSGGGQDKQLSELIEITSLAEKNQNIYFIAFLDGKYANEFFNQQNIQPKLRHCLKIVDKQKNSNKISS